MTLFSKINCKVLFIVGVFYGCTPVENKPFEIPKNIQALNNVFIFSQEDIAITDSVRLIRDQVFGDTEDVYIGRVREFISDESGKIFIVDSAPGSRTIHVYASDGSYITNLGREGRGPGEFLNPCCLRIRSNQLFVFDHGLARLTIYSADSLDLQEIINMDQDRMDNSGQLQEKRFLNYYFLDDETLLLEFTKPQNYFDEKPGSLHYYTVDASFQQLGKEVFEQQQIMESWGIWHGNRIMKYFPFFHKPLLTVTQSGRIFTASSDEFFIQEYSSRGEVKGGFYYPVKKIRVNRNDAIISANEMDRAIADNVDIPDHWPVMKFMWSDDKDRIWISTFTEYVDELTWWIIEPNGELTARFHWPGDRHAYPLLDGKTFKHIRGDYFYTREDDKETGLQTVVRYRIELESK